jgi:uncharacterized protein
MRLPTDDEIQDLHRRCAPTPEAFELVHTHCEIVRRIAEQLLARRDHGLDAELVRVGCLLHDIGVYRLFDGTGALDHSGYIRHGVLGRDLLQELGFDERLWGFCARHIGMGLTREDVCRQGLPIPVADYLPESGEEELVMYADKFHRKTSPPVFMTADSCAITVRRFGDDKARRFAASLDRFGEPDLVALAAVYGHAVR